MPVFYNSGKQVIWQESEIKNLGSLSNHVLFIKREWKKHFSPLECLYPLHQHFACFQAHGWEYFKFIPCFAKLNHLVKFNLVSKLLPILFRIQDGWRHYSLLGDQPGSTEANGAQECKLVQPESAEPPKNTYTCTAESLHAAKRKEKKKNLNGRESNSITRNGEGETPYTNKQKSYIKSLHSKGMRQEWGQTIISLRHPT